VEGVEDVVPPVIKYDEVRFVIHDRMNQLSEFLPRILGDHAEIIDLGPVKVVSGRRLLKEVREGRVAELDRRSAGHDHSVFVGAFVCRWIVDRFGEHRVRVRVTIILLEAHQIGYLPWVE